MERRHRERRRASPTDRARRHPPAAPRSAAAGPAHQRGARRLSRRQFSARRQGQDPGDPGLGNGPSGRSRGGSGLGHGPAVVARRRRADFRHGPPRRRVWPIWRRGQRVQEIDPKAMVPGGRCSPRSRGQAIWTSAAKEWRAGGMVEPILAFSGWYTARRQDEILAQTGWPRARGGDDTGPAPICYRSGHLRHFLMTPLAAPGNDSGDYMAGRIGMIAMLAILAAQEAERGLAARAWENGALRAVGQDRRRPRRRLGQLAEAAGAPDGDESWSALDGANAQLTGRSVALHGSRGAGRCGSGSRDPRTLPGHGGGPTVGLAPSLGG